MHSVQVFSPGKVRLGEHRSRCSRRCCCCCCIRSPLSTLHSSSRLASPIAECTLRCCRRFGLAVFVSNGAEAAALLLFRCSDFYFVSASVPWIFPLTFLRTHTHTHIEMRRSSRVFHPFAVQCTHLMTTTTAATSFHFTSAHASCNPSGV